jgi:hypothetical protein
MSDGKQTEDKAVSSSLASPGALIALCSIQEVAAVHHNFPGTD